MNREPTVTDALERTYEAGQSLIVRRIDLLVAEAKLFAQSGALAVVGGVLALIGWILLVQGVVDGLSQRMPRYAVELGVGLLHVAIAAALMFRVRSRTDG
jgi:membrane-bound ClpP family serine protease